MRGGSDAGEVDCLLSGSNRLVMPAWPLSPWLSGASVQKKQRTSFSIINLSQEKARVGFTPQWCMSVEGMPVSEPGL